MSHSSYSTSTVPMHVLKTVLRPITITIALLLLGACASSPKSPDWQLEAKASVDRSVSAYLNGNSRVEQAELTRARDQLSSTGRPDFMATAELLHCATRVASLVFEPCSAFEALRLDATDAQRAYANYLQGKSNLSAQTMALLPLLTEAQRAVATGHASAMLTMTDPLSQLVAAGVLLQTDQASPAVIKQAIDTASAQGWRRPLLVWLGVQARRAEQAGDVEEAARIHRRIDLASPAVPTGQANQTDQANQTKSNPAGDAIQ